MEREEIDISLMPAADVFESPGLSVLKDLCISSFGKVQSVILRSKKPMGEIRSVAVDSGSSSSAKLLKVALEIFSGANPVYEKRGYGKDFFTCMDAGLAIGNAGLEALSSPPEGFPLCFDLGEVWTRQTGLPFVYAVFTAREGFDPRGALPALKRAKEKGVKMLGEIARKRSAALGLGEELCRDYLENRIGYDLGEAEIKGLMEFGRLISAEKDGGETNLNFAD